MMYCLPLISFSHLPNIWLTQRLSFFLTASQQILDKSFYWSTCRQVLLIRIVSIWPCFTSCLCSEASSHTSPSLPESTASAGVLYRGASALTGRNAQPAPDRDSGERGSRGGAGGAGPWALSARGAGEVQPVHRRPGEGGEPAAVPLCSAGEGPERPEHRGPTHRCWREGEQWKSYLVCQFVWYHEIHRWPWLMLNFTFISFVLAHSWTTGLWHNCHQSVRIRTSYHE